MRIISNTSVIDIPSIIWLALEFASYFGPAITGIQTVCPPDDQKCQTFRGGAYSYDNFTGLFVYKNISDPKNQGGAYRWGGHTD